MDIPDPLPPDHYVIYALIDPSDEIVYYVGLTCNPKRRLEQHLGARHHKGKKGDWLRRLSLKDQQPLMQVLEVVIGEKTALEKEQEWILHFVEKKMPLFNAQVQLSRDTVRRHSIPVAEVCRIQTIVPGAPPIIVARLPDGESGATLRSLCNLLGLDQSGQSQRIRRSSLLAVALQEVIISTSGGPQQAEVLLDWAISIWAAGLQVSRLSEAKQAIVQVLQQKAFAAFLTLTTNQQNLKE